MKVASLHIYPVKSIAGLNVPSFELEERGPRGDRRWMVVDVDGRHVTQREVGALATVRCVWRDGVLNFVAGPSVMPADAVRPVGVRIWKDDVDALEAPPEVSRWISERVEADLRLVYLPVESRRPVDLRYGQEGDTVGFADGYPLLIASLSSLGLLCERMGRSIPIRRFRPNIVVEDSEPFAEDTWRRIRVGSVEMDVVKPCKRCVVVDTDPDTGRRSDGVLRELATFRRWEKEVYFGQNAIPRALGRVSVGDELEVLETGEARPPVG